MFMHDMLITMNLTSGLEIQEPPSASGEFIKAVYQLNVKFHTLLMVFPLYLRCRSRECF
jgi:hypothetical protein